MPSASGVIQKKDTSRETARGEPYVEIDFLADGNQYPWTMRDFGEETAWSEWNEGDRATITFDEKEVTGRSGKPITYRNVTNVAETGSAPAQTAARKHQEAPKRPATAPTEAKPSDTTKAQEKAPAASPRQWSEAYSQSREAHDDQRRSIEAQTAYKEAMAQVRDLVTVEKLDPLGNIAVYQRLLTDLTLIGLAAMREARGIQGNRAPENNDDLPF